MSLHVTNPASDILIIQYDSPITLPLEVDGEIFTTPVELPDELFYDFIVGADGVVNAVQLQIPRRHKLSCDLFPLTRDLPDSVEFSPFLRIWLTGQRDGTESGVEAFGDLLLFERQHRGHALAFCRSWLATAGC
jgi:hypothetical protein